MGPPVPSQLSLKFLQKRVGGRNYVVRVPLQYCRYIAESFFTQCRDLLPVLSTLRHNEFFEGIIVRNDRLVSTCSTYTIHVCVCMYMQK